MPASTFSPPVRKTVTAWRKPWYFTFEGWHRYLVPRFVLPSRSQILLTAAIHFGLGLGALVCAVLRGFRRRTAPARILFLGRYHLGDVLMIVPALTLARRQLPDAAMTLTVQARYRDQIDFSKLRLETTPEIEGLGFLEETRAWRNRFRELGCDAVVFHRITRPDFPAILAAFLENIPHRMGGGEKGMQGFLTDCYFPSDRELVVNYHWRLMEAWLQLPLDSADLRWPLGEQSVGVAKRWDLLIAPFAQHTKEWPAENWHTLLRHARRLGLAVALSAGPTQTARAAELLGEFPEVTNLSTESKSLSDLFTHVRQSRCVVAVDTGIRHVAAASNVPCVVIGHGREHRDLFGAYVPTERYLVHPVPCAPCGAEPCPLGHLQCIRGIAVAEVITSWHSLVPPSAS